MSGHELAKSLRGDLLLREIPLIAVTGYGQPEDVKRATDAGFHQLLVKPVSVDALHATIQHLTDSNPEA